MPVARLLRGLATAAAVIAVCGSSACTNDEPGPSTTSVPSAFPSSGTTAGPASSGDVRPTPAAARPGIAGDAGKCTYKTYGGAGVPKLDLKSAKLGFAQSDVHGTAFRAAQTESMKNEAKRLGYTLVVSNAAGALEQQISDIKEMVADDVKAIIVSPVSSDGLQPALDDAKAHTVPVFTVDRMLADSFDPCDSYIGYAGSDPLDQGKRAAAALIRATRGSAKAVTLLGPAAAGQDDLNAGFRAVIASEPGIEVLAEQAGNFTRGDGQKAIEQLLRLHPDITAIYAQNDELALGAKAALQGAERPPGDTQIVTIGGTRDAMRQIIDGWIFSMIESNPRLGPITFASLDAFYNDNGVALKQVVPAAEFTRTNAEAAVAGAY
ncbi:MAG: substrate-binding domain-containing protein [Mycobacteriales bacterium]